MIVGSSVPISTQYAERLLGTSWRGNEPIGDWEKHRRDCLRHFDTNPEPVRLKILNVKLGGPTDEDAGIVASAKVRARWNDRSDPWTYKLVRYDDDWKVVFEVR